MRRLLPLALALFATHALAQTPASTPLTLEQVMADPDWIGPQVEDAWWAWDGRHVQYQLKRAGSGIRDTWQQPVDGGAASRVDGAARATLDASGAVYDPQHARMAYARNGDIFVRDLRSGALTQLTRSNDEDALPQWSSDGGLVWRVGNDWYRWDARNGVRQAAVIKAEKDPGAQPDADPMREHQLRLIETLRDDKARRDAAREQDEAWRASDPSRAPAPVYLGADVEIADSALSPDGRWLLVVTTAKGADAGKTAKLPHYVTESGYQEPEEGRTVVGHNAPLPHALWLVDVAGGKPRRLSFDGLPGIKEDPLRRSTGRTIRATSRCWCARSTTRTAGSSRSTPPTPPCTRATTCTTTPGSTGTSTISAGCLVWMETLAGPCGTCRRNRAGRSCMSMMAAARASSPKATGKPRSRSCRPMAARSSSSATAIARSTTKSARCPRAAATCMK